MIVQGLILLSCVFGLSRPHITTFCVFGESLWITPTLFIINNRHLYQNIRRPSKLDIHICGPRPEPTYYVCFQAQELCKKQSIQQPQTIMYLFFYSIKDLSADNTSGLQITGKKVASISLIKIIIIITDHNLDLQESGTTCVFITYK